LLPKASYRITRDEEESVTTITTTKSWQQPETWFTDNDKVHLGMGNFGTDFNGEWLTFYLSDDLEVPACETQIPASPATELSYDLSTNCGTAQPGWWSDGADRVAREYTLYYAIGDSELLNTATTDYVPEQFGKINVKLDVDVTGHDVSVTDTVSLQLPKRHDVKIGQILNADLSFSLSKVYDDLTSHDFSAHASVERCGGQTPPWADGANSPNTIAMSYGSKNCLKLKVKTTGDKQFESGMVHVNGHVNVDCSEKTSSRRRLGQARPITKLSFAHASSVVAEELTWDSSESHYESGEKILRIPIKWNDVTQNRQCSLSYGVHFTITPCDTTGQTYCQDAYEAPQACDQAGTYCPAIGVVAPIDCPKGSKCPSGERVPCPSGEFQAAVGQTTCDTCSADKYSGKSAAECTPCASGSWTDSATGASQCVECPAGYQGVPALPQQDR